MNSPRSKTALVILFIFCFVTLSARIGLNSPESPGHSQFGVIVNPEPGLREGVYVQDVEISIQGGTLTLNWYPALDSGYYKVFSSAVPEGPFTRDYSGTMGDGVWTTQIDSERRFYYVASDFAWVEGGTFNNGSSNVTLSGFYISRDEVFQRKYSYLMQENPAQGFGVGDSYPVYLVSWFNAIEFCNRYSIMEGLAPCYSYSTYGTDPDGWPAGWDQAANHLNISCDWEANGYRLPTDMEWEFAARGGNLSQGFTYSGGNHIENVAWYSGNSDNSTHEVGTREPNELGIHDMSGNVKEFCWDIWGALPTEDQTDPHGPSTGSMRVVRNGHFNSGSDSCPVDYRAACPGADVAAVSYGFRVCRILPKLPTPTFDPPSCGFGFSETVTVTCADPGATIRYTTDGSEPDMASDVYTGPLEITTGTTLKAKAFKPLWDPSQTAIGQYMPNSLVEVPGGTFNNGTADVTITPFRMLRFEVTQSEFEATMGFNPAMIQVGVGPNLPVYQVNWMEALAYCNQRSIDEGRTPCYSYGAYGTDPDDWPADLYVDSSSHLNFSCNWYVNGYRLPTEMEWMYAALGGHLSQGFTYSGSDNIDDVAWYTGNSGNSIQQIGLKMPNELGLYDMSGNLWEWCWDIYGDYPAEAQSNPTGPDTGEYRDLRGGAYGSSASPCENAWRGFTLPIVRHPQGGFRVIRRYN